MISVEHIDVYGFEHAIRAMRHPMLSYNKSDSKYCLDLKDCNECKYNDEDPEACNDPYYDFLDGYIVGDNDLDLMQRLYRSGTEHRTYARMIMVWMDITAPLYWWKEMDRYAIGKSQVSCSTMHKIAAKEFEYEDFSHEHLKTSGRWLLGETIKLLNKWREVYINGNPVYSKGDKEIWWQMIQSLPSSYNQKRTICMSYEVVFKMIRERTGHRLDEWNTFVEILKTLPYVRDIMGEEE